MDAALAIIMKYPEIDYYFGTSNNYPVFMKLMTSILIIRQKLGYTVSESESFYSSIHQIDANIFVNISKEDLPQVLECFVILACSYICDTDVIDVDDEVGQRSKNKICDNIMKYMIAN